MSAKRDKKARAIARFGFAERLDDSIAEQMPRWCRAVIRFAEGVPAERLLMPYIRHWRKRYEKGNAVYRAFSLKKLARTARAIMNDAGKAGSHRAGKARSRSAEGARSST